MVSSLHICEFVLTKSYLYLLTCVSETDRGGTKFGKVLAVKEIGLVLDWCRRGDEPTGSAKWTRPKINKELQVRIS